MAAQRPRSSRTSRAPSTVQKRRIPQTRVNPVNTHGNVNWHGVNKELYQVVKDEPVFDIKGEPVKFRPIVGRQKVFDYLAQKYIQYLVIYRKLEKCMERLVHPQKRILLKRSIEATAGRVLELRHEIINFEKTFFSSFDDMLVDMNLTPDDLEIQVPRYVLSERKEIIAMRDYMLKMMLERIRSQGKASLESLLRGLKEEQDEDHTTYSSEEADDMMDNISVKSKSAPGQNGSKQGLVYVPNEFISRLIRTIDRDHVTKMKIVTIQRHWRNWLCKQMVNRMRNELDVDLGMRMPEQLEELHSGEEKKYAETEKIWSERHDEQVVAKEFERARFMDKESQNMAWELKYNLTQWMIEMRDLQGSFPVFPEEKDGGLGAIFSNKTVAEVVEELEELDDPKKKKPEKKDKKKGKKEEKKKKKGDEDEDGWVIPRSEMMTHLTGTLKDYDDYWYQKDEMNNPDQVFDEQLVLEEVKENASQIIRKQVEELMRLELDRLKYAVDRERKPKPKKEKKKKEKKGKGKKGGDPTGGKSVEELYGELVLQGIVKPVEKKRFTDFLGQHNFLATTLGNCVPNAPEIRNFLIQLVALPMSSDFLHTSLPLFNSMMLAGPKGTGKTLLVHSLCSEIGATLFDISPRTLAGKYEGKKAEEYLWNVLLKVGKAMEPSVFLIEDCERLFPKTPPKGLDDKPQRWAKVWPKMMHKKKMKKGDRMFLLGLTSNPFATKPKPMFKLFKNVVYVPCPDYGSRMVLWNYFLNKVNGSQHKKLDLSIIAKLTNGYTGRDIENLIHTLPHKVSHRKLKNLSNQDIIASISSSSGPMYLEEMEAWAEWYEKTPLMKSRLQMLARLEEAAEEAAAGKGGKGGKKK